MSGDAGAVEPQVGVGPSGKVICAAGRLFPPGRPRTGQGSGGIMGGFSETWRGGSAIARWLGGAPLMSLRVTLMARNRQAARAILTRHSAKMLGSCRIEVAVDGPAPAPGMGRVLCYNETSLADVVAFSAVMWPYIDRAAAADIYAWIPLAHAATVSPPLALTARPLGSAFGFRSFMAAATDTGTAHMPGVIRRSTPCGSCRNACARVSRHRGISPARSPARPRIWSIAAGTWFRT